MNGDSTGYSRVSPDAASLHSEAEQYAVFVNQEVADANAGVSKRPLCGAALFSLTADLLGIHRAVLDLCRSGWAFATVILLRSMMDMLLSTLVLTEKQNDEAEYRGVKYTHAFLKDAINETGRSKSQLESDKAQIQSAIDRAPATVRDKTRDYFYRQRLGAYWYNPEFRSPTEVISRLATPEIGDMYRYFSAGSHGGYLGMRILKDEPDSIHPNPRPDARAQRLAVVGSSRLLVETLYRRDIFENDGKTELIYKSIIQKISRLSGV